MPPQKLISRDEALGGMRGRPIKQANTLLALIENRTAHLLAQVQQPIGFFPTETVAMARNKAYLEAIALEREPPAQLTIQDVERFAAQWAVLVPDMPAIRAAVGQLLSQKYIFTYQDTPGIRAALSLDTEAVRQTYQSLYGRPWQSIFAPQVRLSDRLRWYGTALAKWLDNLPAFWVAFMLTLIIGGVTLALPIAAAGIGALPSVGLIIFFGLINMVTISAMAETVTRTGNIRYGSAFIGRVVADYLGETSSAILSIALTAFSFGLLLIFYLGIATTLEGSTGLPSELWMTLLFLMSLYFLSRGSLNVTIAFTLVTNVIVLSLLLLLSLLGFSHMKWENLLYMNIPLLNGQPFNPALLSAIIGVVLGTYSAHILVAIFGKMILERDPTGRAIVRGHAAGIGFATLMNSIWVLAVNGAIAPQVLARQTGTALVSLTAQVGPVVAVLGAIFVLLSMGMGLIQFSLALFNLTRERFSPQQALALGRRGVFFVSLIPVIVVFLVAQWLSITDSGSFAGILGILGVIVDSLMAGIFPVLLLLASRRKGELVPQVVYRFLGQPALLIGIYLLFLFNLFFHGLFIWQNPIQRAGGVLLGLLMLAVTVNLIRRGAFAPRMVVELRHDQSPGGQTLLSVTTNGQPVIVETQLIYGDGQQQSLATPVELPDLTRLQGVYLQLPPSQAQALKVWSHQITPVGDNEPLPIVAKLSSDNREQILDLGAAGQTLLSLNGQAAHLEIKLNISREQNNASVSRFNLLP